MSRPTKWNSSKPTNPSLPFGIGGRAVKVCIPKSTYLSRKIKYLNHLTAKVGT